MSYIFLGLMLLVLAQSWFIFSLMRNKRRSVRTDAEQLATLDELLQQRAAQLELVNKELEAFSYAVSHDLRAPLRGVDGWSLALQEDYAAQLDQTAHQYLDQVRTETQRMSQMIDALLGLSRVAQTKLDWQALDLSLLAHAVVRRIRETQPARQIEFSIQPAMNAHGDPHLIEIALSNLFDNACKFSAARTPGRIEFGSAPEPEAAAGVRHNNVYVIRDNGVGFDMAFAQRLFAPFQHMHQASELSGIGIGLATAQRIFHAHGGRLWAEAQVGQGASFYFTLPQAMPA